MCWNCKEKEQGHLKKNCPKMNGKGKSVDPSATAGVVERDSDEGEPILAANKVTKAHEDVSGDMLATISDSSETSWIFDSGCSYHMCPNGELFTTFEKLEGGKVLMGNNNVYGAIGIDTVRVPSKSGCRSPSTTMECLTPNEKWTGSPTNYVDLKVFGCSAYAHVRERKLNPRAKKCILLGYANGVKWYRLWCPDGSKFLISRDGTFNELAMLKPSQGAKRKVVEHEEQVEPSRKQVELDLEPSENPQ
ncbi:hypothetical protein CRG98_001413 [Punica granatum]|uniref:CCHC-type domain-containing protein n=1 Tax=Punica granatum TaxID=22663 RepID=A0A2I0LC41_PUNGR|nr:hypothetical protein CRG98_001413 [Punica granatum]